MRIRKTLCPACGAFKQRPSATAYIYCDYCGALVDWDFQLACRTPGSAWPGPVYEALCAELAPLCEAARAADDRNAYQRLQERLFDAYAAHCPAACPPRLGDAAYRERYLAYQAAVATALAFDPAHRVLMEAMQTTIAGLVWSGLPAPKVGRAGFWRLVEAVERQLVHGYAVAEATGAATLDPDGMPRALRLRRDASTFAQGWLPYLDAADAEGLLTRFGLAEVWTELAEPDLEARHCGGCGGGLRIVAGARVVVCEACGTRLDAATPEQPCSGCGARITFPEGAVRASCPACRTEFGLATGLS